MTQSRFFQTCLFFPVALWCLCLLIFSLAYKEGASFILSNMSNAYRVFIPYLIFGAGLWKIAQDKPYRLLIPLAAAVPVVWGVFFTVFYILMGLVISGTIEKWYVLLIMGFWAIVVAYLMEIIPLIVLVTFKDDFRHGDSEKPAGQPLEECRKA